MLHVHRQALGFDFDFCLQWAVRDLSQRSHARLKHILQECAQESLILLLVSLLTITTLVWVVTTVADTPAAQTASLDQVIPIQPAATSVADFRGPVQWADVSNSELGVTQSAAEAGH